jgi:hypothetical protein
VNDKAIDEIARGNLNILIQTAITQEHERIIKLLEIEAVRHEQLLLGASADYLLGIIDFIKGENK